MEKLINGFKSNVKRTLVKPYLYHDGKLTVNYHYTGYVSCFENCKKLWSKSTGVTRISRGAAEKDCRVLVGELIRERFYNDNPDIKRGE